MSGFVPLVRCDFWRVGCGEFHDLRDGAPNIGKTSTGLGEMVVANWLEQLKLAILGRGGQSERLGPGVQ